MGKWKKSFEAPSVLRFSQISVLQEEVIRFRERLSINFLGLSGRRTKQVLDLVKKKGRADDENALTMAANTEFKVVEVVYMRLVADHVTFLKQIQNYQKVDEKIIQLYS